jgi:hypothetical protein
MDPVQYYVQTFGENAPHFPQKTCPFKGQYKEVASALLTVTDHFDRVSIPKVDPANKSVQSLPLHLVTTMAYTMSMPKASHYFETREPIPSRPENEEAAREQKPPFLLTMFFLFLTKVLWNGQINGVARATEILI